MGLDNGIIITKGVKRKNIPSFVHFDNYIKPTIELCYWRKCWGIRGMILQKLHGRDSDHTDLNVEDIPVIIKILKYFCSEKHWEEEADSIWEYKDFKDILIDQIINLSWLYDYWQQHPNLKCYFYDSY